MPATHKRSMTILSRVLILFVTLFVPLRTTAQTTEDQIRIQIASKDYAEFPEVKVRAIIQGENRRSLPLEDVGRNFELLENDQPVCSDERCIARVEPGVEVLFVLDVGTGITNRMNSGKTRLDVMLEILQNYVMTMGGEDTTGVIVVTPGDTKKISLTSGQTQLETDIKNIINGLAADPPIALSRGQDGIKAALSELAGPLSKRSSLVQTIVFISSGLQMGSSGLETIYKEANREKIAIHTILVRDEELTASQNYSGSLKEIAAETKGIYTFYKQATSTKGVLTWISEQRAQYQFRFRSQLGDTSSRTLKLRMKDGGGLQVSTTYRVDVKPPAIVIRPLEDNGEYIRKSTSPDADWKMVEPTMIQVGADVSWPDGYRRAIKQAQLLVNGTPVETLSDLGVDTTILQFSLDLTAYRTVGTTSAELYIKVQDELDLTSTSNPVAMKVTVIIPPTPTKETPLTTTSPEVPLLPTEKCAGLSGFQFSLCRLNTIAGWVSLGVAAIALVMVIAFRGQIAGAAVQVGDAVRETVARITRPPQTEIRAYLNVIRGAEDLPRNRFPIYGNTVTPIGRDKRQAELVFDENAERSVVSRIHCEITEQQGNFYIRDLGSTHGTFVNGKKLPELGNQMLSDGDQIEIGPVERGGILLLFQLAGEESFYPPSDEDLASRVTEVM